MGKMYIKAHSLTAASNQQLYYPDCNRENNLQLQNRNDSELVGKSFNLTAPSNWTIVKINKIIYSQNFESSVL